jgi:leucyl/phenylalanyl-tRNA--protein transferase
MALDDGEIGWFSPDPRGIIPLEPPGFHIPHGLRRVLKRNPFVLRMNTAFEGVMQACARRAETWISDEIIRSYRDLHQLGYAHSVECWQADELVGGLYGVALGGAFFGESMFHTATDASKVALVRLVEWLRIRGYSLLDIQWTTPHLKSFGAVEVTRTEYLQRLATALEQSREFS